MIKFFRKIRQRLLIERRLSKYFLYAIGEIVLVVIGILIALQINNRNEFYKTKQKEFALLTELKQNLKDDSAKLSEILVANEDRIRSNEIVKYSFESKLPWHDSLKYHFGNTWGNWQLTENTSTWENLKSIGLDLISNNSLRNSISELYSTKYIYLENLEKGFDDKFQQNQLYPQMLKNINIDSLWFSGTPENYKELAENREFLEVIKMNIFIRKYMQGQYNDVLKTVSIVSQQLEDHIQYLKVEELGRDAKRKHRFVLKGYDSDSKVQIAGSFNNWTPTNMIFKDGIWQKEIELLTDEVQLYKFIVDDKWIHDKENQLTRDDGHGGVNSIVIIDSSN